MAEKKKIQHTFVSADDGTQTDAPVVHMTAAAPALDKKGATKFRLGAAGLWLVAIACEILAVLSIVKGWTPALLWPIIFLVVDLACVIGGSLLWKKSNRIDPASEENKVKFWLWNNLGLIVCALAFIPFIIIVLTNKQADKKTKVIATVVAVIALLIGGLCSYEWDPFSAQDLAALQNDYGTHTVYWTKSGKKFHLYDDCQHLSNTEELKYGTVEQATQAGRQEVCLTCDKKYKKELAESATSTEENADAEKDLGADATDAATEAEEDAIPMGG